MLRHYRGISLAVAALALLVLFAGTSAEAQTVDVAISGFAFVPDTVRVSPGTTVRWTNNDGAPHTSTSDDPMWDSGTLTTGQDWSYIFTTPGIYPYHCEIHPSMTAVVIISSPAPALSSVSMGLLGLLLAGLSVWWIRRQRPATGHN